MIDVLETIASPSGTGGGDDRFGFDEAAGLAFVVDGATDVGLVRLFNEGESDAALYAETLSAKLIHRPAVPSAEEARDFAEILSEMAIWARSAARVNPDEAPRHMLPSAAVARVRVTDGRLSFAAFGDCMLVLRTSQGVSVYGDQGKIDDEAQHAAAMAAAPDADARRAISQAARARLNTPDGYWIASIDPAAADHLRLAERAVSAGDVGLLVTDGLYRLVAPYGLMSPGGLIETAVESGLEALVAALRAYEAEPGHIGRAARSKPRDDATGLLFQIR